MNKVKVRGEGERWYSSFIGESDMNKNSQLRVKTWAMAFAFAFAFTFVFAEVPVSINYTGCIEGENGKVKSKALPMAFRLYDRPGTGRMAEKATALWGRQASVALTDGVFDVDLKDTFGTQLANTRYDALADAIVAALQEGTGELYVGLTPANDANAEIYPRLRLTAAPKTVQARAVRTLPNGFTATNGTFSVEKALVVNGASTMRGDTSYAATAFGPASSTSFAGGVAVKGTLRAGAVSASTLKADAMSVTSAATASSGRLTVDGTLAVNGSAVWEGDIGKPVGTNAASRVIGTVDANRISATTLVASNFVNKASSFKFYKHEGDWHLICDWVTVASVNENVGHYDMSVYDPRRTSFVDCQSISVGTWVAPCDCLALFQTFVCNLKELDPACIQFFIVPTADFDAFKSVTPNAVAMVSNGNGTTIESVVPLLLRKGQVVKWLGYNNNSAISGLEEVDQTKVESISYQPFGWSE